MKNIRLGFGFNMSSSWGAKGYTLEVIAENKNSGMDENRFFYFM